MLNRDLGAWNKSLVFGKNVNNKYVKEKLPPPASPGHEESSNITSLGEIVKLMNCP